MFQALHITEEPVYATRPRNPHDNERRKEHYDKYRSAHQAQTNQETFGRKPQYHCFVPDTAIDGKFHRNRTFMAPYTMP